VLLTVISRIAVSIALHFQPFGGRRESPASPEPEAQQLHFIAECTEDGSRPLESDPLASGTSVRSWASFAARGSHADRALAAVA